MWDPPKNLKKLIVQTLGWKRVFILISFTKKNKYALEIAKIDIPAYIPFFAGVEIGLEERRIQH